jgi:chaperonin GroES
MTNVSRAGSNILRHSVFVIDSSFGNSSFGFENRFQLNLIVTLLERIRHMAAPKLRPLDDRVVVEPMEAEEKTAGGIVLPDTAKEKPQRGTVKAIGPGRLLDSGTRAEVAVRPGDVVIYGKYSGSDIEVDGKEVKILRETDILAKVLA